MTTIETVAFTPIHEEKLADASANVGNNEQTVSQETRLPYSAELHELAKVANAIHSKRVGQKIVENSINLLQVTPHDMQIEAKNLLKSK